MNLDILDDKDEDLDTNMFCCLHKDTKHHMPKRLPNIFISTKYLYSTTEVKSLTTPTMDIANPRDDIFVRKYIHSDLRLVPSAEYRSQSYIDFYALGYTNNIEIENVNIHYSLMLCIPNNDDKGIFYKIQLTPSEDIDIVLYTCMSIFCATDPHKSISLKKNTREELDYRLE